MSDLYREAEEGEQGRGMVVVRVEPRYNDGAAALHRTGDFRFAVQVACGLAVEDVDVTKPHVPCFPFPALCDGSPHRDFRGIMDTR